MVDQLRFSLRNQSIQHDDCDEETFPYQSNLLCFWTPLHDKGWLWLLYDQNHILLLPLSEAAWRVGDWSKSLEPRTFVDLLLDQPWLQDTLLVHLWTLASSHAEEILWNFSHHFPSLQQKHKKRKEKKREWQVLCMCWVVYVENLKRKQSNRATDLRELESTCSSTCTWLIS